MVCEIPDNLMYTQVMSILWTCNIIVIITLVWFHHFNLSSKCHVSHCDMSNSELLDTPLECKNSCFHVQHERAEIFINDRMCEQRVFNLMNLEMDRTLATVISCSGRGLAAYCVWIGQKQVIWGSIKGRAEHWKCSSNLHYSSNNDTMPFDLSTWWVVRIRNVILLTLFWFVVGETFIAALWLL